MFSSDRIKENWLDRNGDYELALAEGIAILEYVEEERLDPWRELELVKDAFEVVADADGGDPLLARRAMKVGQRAFRQAESSGELSAVQRISARSEAALLLARANHCAGLYQDALLDAYTLIGPVLGSVSPGAN